MRAVRNLVAPPIVIITDSKEFAFNFPTRFRVDVSKIRKLFLAYETQGQEQKEVFLIATAHDKVAQTCFKRASFIGKC